MSIVVSATIDSNGAVKGANEFNAALAKMRLGVAETGKAIDSHKLSVDALKGALVGLAASVVVRQAIQAADNWQLLRTRLESTIGSATGAQASLAALGEAADKAGVPTMTLANAYADIVRVLKDKKRTEQEGILSLQLLAQALQISGASAQQQEQAFSAFTRAMVSGRMEVRGFYEVMATVPILMTELQRQTGKTATELRRMAELGMISGETLMQVLLNAGTRIEARFREVPETVGSAWEGLTAKVSEQFAKVADTSQLRDAINNLKEVIASPEFLQALRSLGDAMTVITNASAWLIQKMSELHNQTLAASHAITDQLAILNNYDGALTRAGQSVSRFASSFMALRQNASSPAQLAAQAGQLSPFTTTVTADTSVPSAGPQRAVPFAQSQVTQQAKQLLEMERARTVLEQARLSNNQQAINQAQTELAVRGSVTAELRLGAPEIAKQIEGQIRLNQAIQQQAERIAKVREIGQEAFRTVTDGLTQGIAQGQKFGDMLRNIASKLVEVAANAAFLKPLEKSFGNAFAAAIPGFNPEKGLLSFLPGFADGGILDGPGVFVGKGGVRPLAENGPEAVVPLRRGSSGQLGIASASGGGNGGMTQVIEINVAGDATDATVEKMRQVARNEFSRGAPGLVRASVSAVGDEHRRNANYLRR